MSELQKKSVMQGEDWSGEMGDKWNRYRDQFEGMITPIGAATLAHAQFKTGERVLDIGCGAGPTTLEIARQIGNTGKVTGLDISPTLVATATARAAEAGLENAHFVCADAATATLETTGFDCLFSRFGVMFFEDPIAAFTNIHRMLDSNARLVFCCWGPPPENPWVGSLSAIINNYITLPPPDPVAPGPFAFADRDRTAGILQSAGFKEIKLEAWRGRQLLGGPGMNPDMAMDFALKAFFLGQALEGQPLDLVNAVKADVRALFEEHQSADGIEMDAMAWLVSARA